MILTPNPVQFDPAIAISLVKKNGLLLVPSAQRCLASFVLFGWTQFPVALIDAAFPVAVHGVRQNNELRAELIFYLFNGGGPVLQIFFPEDIIKIV